jgi:hypothetical protein
MYSAIKGAGYDIRSQISSCCNQPLLIEVKASTQDWANAKLHLTRHEWDVLSGEHNAVIHLWSLARRPPEHAIIPISEMAAHIPANQGGGEWESAECPFSAFEKGCHRKAPTSTLPIHEGQT